MPEVFEGGQKEKETERDKERERDSEKERGRERRRCSVMWHRKAEQLSPESRLSHKLMAAAAVALTSGHFVACPPLSVATAMAMAMASVCLLLKYINNKRHVSSGFC